MFKDSVLKKINAREATVGVIGLGYVGLPLIRQFSQSGYNIIGFDIDVQKIRALSSGKSYIEHIPDQDIRRLNECGGIFTHDFSEISSCDVIIACVPTPLTHNQDPDLSYVHSTLDNISPFLRQGQVFSLESTTYPGTTDEIVRTRIEGLGFTVGDDFFLLYSPEREDPGNPVFSTETIPKLVAGCSPQCADIGVSLYSGVINQVIKVSSPAVAEMAKLLENIHRAVNIGLVNEMKVVAQKMGIDIFEVIDAAASKPFGFTAYYPGPGIGGHCIPIDPFYLTWKAKEYGVHTKFIELAGEVNAAMPHYVFSKLVGALNSRGKPVKDSRVLFLGIAYKRNVGDMRESPSLELMNLAREAGAVVEYSDPHVPEFPRLRNNAFDLKSVTLTAEALESYEAVVLATDHFAFDYDLIVKHARLIIDTRGRYRAGQKNIVCA